MAPGTSKGRSRSRCPLRQIAIDFLRHPPNCCFPTFRQGSSRKPEHGVYRNCHEGLLRGSCYCRPSRSTSGLRVEFPKVIQPGGLVPAGSHRIETVSSPKPEIPVFVGQRSRAISASGGVSGFGNDKGSVGPRLTISEVQPLRRSGTVVPGDPGPLEGLWVEFPQVIQESRVPPSEFDHCAYPVPPNNQRLPSLSSQDTGLERAPGWL